MALTEAQKLAREGKLTASRVACLMTGDKAKIMALWRELCGDPLHEEEDLEHVWDVRMGELTEELNLEWYERKRSVKVSRRGEVVQHPDYSWAAATLDGFDPSLPGPIEAKHVGGYEKREVIVQRYQPQIQWQMEVTGTQQCAFSVIEGKQQPRVEIIQRNKVYADELMARALRLMECVWSMREPVQLEPVELRTISPLKDYDFNGSNEWAHAAADWLSHRKAAEMFENAQSKLKELIPRDAKSVIGYDVVARRDRASRISIRGIHDKPAKKSK